jgi:uncharacterized membrane protein YdjX (TVP38/TMEM64 family)
VAIAAVLVVAALGAAWRWTPLAEWLDMETVTAVGRTIRSLPLSPLLVIAAYVAGGLVVLPVTLLIAATGIVFGPVLGALYAWLGAIASAAVLYVIGRWLGRDALRRYGGERVNRVSNRLAREGLMAVALVRMLPVAPFSIVNVVAGASRIRARDFLLGTALGMAPGIVATVAIVDGVAGGFSARSVAITLSGVALVVATGWYARRRAAADGPSA